MPRTIHPTYARSQGIARCCIVATDTVSDDDDDGDDDDASQKGPGTNKTRQDEKVTDETCLTEFLERIGGGESRLPAKTSLSARS